MNQRDMDPDCQECLHLEWGTVTGWCEKMLMIAEMREHLINIPFPDYFSVRDNHTKPEL